MKVELIHLNQLFKEKLAIPSYQRKYSWSEGDVKEYIDNLLENNDKPHIFLGMVIVKHDNSGGALKIIDGQQRIVTTQLLNLYLKSKAVDSITVDLKTHNEDNEDYELLEEFYNSAEISLTTGGQIINNYRYITEYLSTIETKLPHTDGEQSNASVLDELSRSLKKLDFVKLTLEENDDAQGVLSVLNSTGKQLSDFDLIKNLSLITSEDTYGVWHKLIEYSKKEGISEDEALKRVLSFSGQIPVYLEVNRLGLFNIYKQITRVDNTFNLMECIREFFIKLDEIDNITLDDTLVSTINQFRWIPLSNIENVLNRLLSQLTKNLITQVQLQSILQSISTFYFKSKVCGVDTSDIMQRISNAFPQDSKCNKDLVPKSGIISKQNTDFFNPKDTKTSEKSKTSEIEVSVHELWNYNLFYKDAVYCQMFTRVPQIIQSGTKLNDELLEYIFKSCESKINRTKPSFEGSYLTKCIPVDLGGWKEYFEQNGIEDYLNLSNKFYNSLANYMFIEDSIGYSCEDPNKMFTNLSKSKFSMTRAYKKIGVVSEETMQARLDKLVNLCEKLWCVPEISMSIIRQNSKDSWFSLRNITSVTGLKANGIKVGEFICEGDTFKSIARTWKQVAYVIIRGLFAESSEVAMSKDVITRLNTTVELLVDSKPIFFNYKEGYEFEKNEVQLSKNLGYRFESSPIKIIKQLEKLANALNNPDMIKIKIV